MEKSKKKELLNADVFRNTNGASDSNVVDSDVALQYENDAKEVNASDNCEGSTRVKTSVSAESTEESKNIIKAESLSSSPKKNEDDDGSDPDRHWKIVLKRQWDLLHLLAMTRPGLTLEELAAKFEVSEKTIKRDLKTLEYVFGRLRTKNEAHGRKRYCFDKSPFTFGLSLDRDELLAIYVGQELMTPLRGTYFWEGWEQSLKKIKGILREETVKYAERVAPFFKRFEPLVTPYTEQMKNLIDQTLISMVDSCALRIKYRSIKARRSKTYDIYPYNFVYWNASIYLIGYCCRDRKIKIWKVDRLYDAQTLPKRKFSRKDFDVEQFLSNAVAPFVGETPVELVTVRFTGYAARIITEEKIRPIEELVKEPSGAVVAKIRTETGKSLTRWILGFGRYADILAPDSLRQKFLSELEAVQELYRREIDNPVEYYAQYERELVENRRQNRVLKRLIELPVESESDEKKQSKRGRPRKNPRL